MSARKTSLLMASGLASSSVLVDVGVLTGVGIGIGTAAAFMVCLFIRLRGEEPDLASATVWTAGFGACCGLWVAIIDHVVH